MLVLSNNQNLIQQTKTMLKTKYETKELGPANNTLQWRITRTPSTLAINQPACMQKLLEDYNMQHCKPMTTPHSAGVALAKRQNDEIELPENRKRQCQQIVGSLRCLADCARPDLAHITGQLGRCSSQPTEKHLQAAYRVLRCLQGARTHGVACGPQRTPLQSFAESDCAADPDTRLSTTGGMRFLNGGPISWRSTRQSTVALSTTEAERIAASTASRHMQWLREMLRELTNSAANPTTLNLATPTTLSMDNQSAIKISQSNEKTRKSKCIDVRHHCIRQLRERGVLETRHTPTHDMKADFLTKQLAPCKFTRNTRQCNIAAE